VAEADRNASIVYSRSSIIRQAAEDEDEGPDVPCVIRGVGSTGPLLQSSASGHRPSTLPPSLSNGAVCTLGVVVDHTYFERVAHGSWQLALSKVSQLVAEADNIFRNTDFDFDSVPENIGSDMV